MPSPRVLVLRAPGTNCDVETAHAFERCGALAERVHLLKLTEEPRRLREFQILCIPGGFSYGDDVGAGVIFGHHLRSHFGDELGVFLRADRLVLGICNGFQVLMRAGILPGNQTWPPQEGQTPDATLTWNDSGRFTARWVHLEGGASRCVFLRGVDRLDLPIAHAEGKLVTRTPLTIESWRNQGQIALTYARPRTEKVPGPSTPPHNPNGSMADIAGLCDPTGRIFGLMPHPERHIDAIQHPQWTRQNQANAEGAGLQIFRNAVEYFG